jgi:hypothetical protein
VNVQTLRAALEASSEIVNKMQLELKDKSTHLTDAKLHTRMFHLELTSQKLML